MTIFEHCPKNCALIKEALNDIKRNGTRGHVSELGNQIRKCVQLGERIPMLARKDEIGCQLVTHTEKSGIELLPFFTDESEITVIPENAEVLFANVNTLIDVLYREKDIAGLVFNIESSGFCVSKETMLHFLLHSGYPMQDYERLPSLEPIAPGIPENLDEKYLMTDEELTYFAIETVTRQPFIADRYDVISANSNPEACPNLILQDENRNFSFVVVDGYCSEKEPSLSLKKKEQLLRLGKKFYAHCFYLPVGLASSKDLERFIKRIAIRGDEYYAKTPELIRILEECL